MKIQNRKLALAICCVAASFYTGIGWAASSLWEHNGSTVYLNADGSAREFRYEQPRSGMLWAGAHPGSLLFTGRSVNGRYVGTAYIFNSRCGQIPYEVSGPILDNYQRVVLRGQAPRLDATCNVVGYFTDTLEFSYLKSTRTTSAIRDGAFAALLPPNVGDELRVVNIATNDVLKMREYPTEGARVIDTIPPDTTGVIYVGQSQGQWVFVRYDRAEGWVSRVFVEPMARRGRRF
jgi:hypothetical protein